MNKAQLAECVRLAENYHKNRLVDVRRALFYYQEKMEQNLQVISMKKNKKWSMHE